MAFTVCKFWGPKVEKHCKLKHTHTHTHLRMAVSTETITNNNNEHLSVPLLIWAHSAYNEHKIYGPKVGKHRKSKK